MYKVRAISYSFSMLFFFIIIIALMKTISLSGINTIQKTQTHTLKTHTAQPKYHTLLLCCEYLEGKKKKKRISE
jgi:hypothetical protein